MRRDSSHCLLGGPTSCFRHAGHRSSHHDLADPFIATALKRASWLRVALEGVVIVASILLAFGIEAWWSRAQEREEETRLLGAVLEDARANLGILEENRAYHAAVLNSARRILQLAGEGSARLSPQEADTLIADLAWWLGSDHWQTGGLDALVGGGRLDLVQDEGLRLTLASWDRNVADVRYAEDQENEFFDAALMPFLRENARVAQIGEIAQVLPGRGDIIDYGRVDFGPTAVDHRPMLESQPFQNLAVHKLWIQTDILSAYDHFQAELVTLIEQLETELSSSWRNQ